MKFIKAVKVVGGLGSQMMAYGLYLALKKKFNNDVFYETGFFEKNYQHNGLEIYRIFGIEPEIQHSFTSKIINSNCLLYKFIRRLIIKKRTISAHTQKYNYDIQVFKDKKIILYDQCWTSYKYFESVENEIRELFVFPDLVGSKNKTIMDEIGVTESVSLHVRRGDYLNSPILGGVIGSSYYKQAIQLVYRKIKKPKFYIFSDDITWCKSELGIKKEDCKFIDWNKSDLSFQDMCLMSHCKHNIIANSSFSWWGAYLNSNKSKIVICPKYWAGKDSGVEMSDMNMPDWIEVDNSSN
jgi:hypothetical protein